MLFSRSGKGFLQLQNIIYLTPETKFCELVGSFRNEMTNSGVNTTARNMA